MHYLKEADYALPLSNNLFSALENVSCELESVIDVLEEYNDYSNSGIKNVILNLTQAFELSFKFILINNHWSFIFKDIDSATFKKMENGDFVSVDFNTAIMRLKNLCSVDYDLTQCKSLCNIRNRLQHFELKINLSKLLEILKKCINELVKFIKKEIFSLLPENAKEDFKSCLEELIKYNKSLASILINKKMILEN